MPRRTQPTDGGFCLVEFLVRDGCAAGRARDRHQPVRQSSATTARREHRRAAPSGSASNAMDEITRVVGRPRGSPVLLRGRGRRRRRIHRDLAARRLERSTPRSSPGRRASPRPRRVLGERRRAPRKSARPVGAHGQVLRVRRGEHQDHDGPSPSRRATDACSSLLDGPQRPPVRRALVGRPHRGAGGPGHAVTVTVTVANDLSTGTDPIGSTNRVTMPNIAILTGGNGCCARCCAPAAGDRDAASRSSPSSA